MEGQISFYFKYRLSDNQRPLKTEGAEKEKERKKTKQKKPKQTKKGAGSKIVEFPITRDLEVEAE